MHFFRTRRFSRGREISPDEILLDSHNLPSFDKDQFEGELEKPIAKHTPLILGLCCVLVLTSLALKTATLQVVYGASFYERSQANTLRFESEFAPRGIIMDRHSTPLAWNEEQRMYTARPGFGHLLGYLGYPREAEFAAGGYEPKELIGIAGAELIYGDSLRGKKGKKLVEIDAHGSAQSEAVHVPPVRGDDVVLSIDAELEHELYKAIKLFADERDFQGGTGIIMDVHTGELLAMTNYPEYDSNAFMAGRDGNNLIANYLQDKRLPFLNRVVQGLYTPGSVVKPFIALAALEEGVITPEKKILSTGELRVANPYDPKRDSIFRDWKAHGWVDMREAIAVSSDIYFYVVGGGYKGEKGLGISRVEEWSKRFGFAKPTGSPFSGEPKGVVPNPEWKELNFDGDPWRVGDTYHTSIGQYGYQVTPMQLVRATAALANGGKLLHPQIISLDGLPPSIERTIESKPENIRVVQEGMRMAVRQGTAVGLNVPYVEVAAKTGTAEIGTTKSYVNSLVVGYFPFDKPRYAFVVLMERGPYANTVGASAAMRHVLDWMAEHAPNYFEKVDSEW